MKLCSCCNTDKEESQFHKDSSSKDGLSYHCKSCAINRSKKRHEENKEAINQKRRGEYNPVKNGEQCRAYREAHKDELRAYKKEWRARNPDRDKERYARDKERILERQRAYNIKNRGKKNADAKRYREANPEKVAKIKDICTKRRRKTDLSFRILDNLRTRLWWALNGNVRSARTIELLGCEIQFLRDHLEKQFVEGMQWDNYGKWEIDHIKPCAKFDFRDEKQQRACFHWSNLQPLWKLDNILKSDRL